MSGSHDYYHGSMERLRDAEERLKKLDAAERLLTKKGRQEWLAQAESEEVQRKVEMPDEAAALQMMFSGYQRLVELGFANVIHCPKDGTIFDAVTAGSTGIFPCYYDGEWPNGRWWIQDGDDVWPGYPALWRERKDG